MTGSPPPDTTGGPATGTAASPAARPGGLRLRPSPAGLPESIDLDPPQVAESGDPFARVRILDLVARLERGRPVLVDDIVAALNGRYLDWLFARSVVLDALVSLQSNWLVDYRNASGIVLSDGALGPTVALEDSSRVDPWIVRQVERAAAACRETLREFSRRDLPNDGS
jgi:hypothetical protein